MSKHAGPERDTGFDGGYVLFAGSGSSVGKRVRGGGAAVETAGCIIQCDIAELDLVQGGDACSAGKGSFPGPVGGLQCFDGDGIFCCQLTGMDSRRSCI